MKSKNRGLCAVIALVLVALFCVCGACVLVATLPPLLGMPVPIPRALPLGVLFDDNFSSKQVSEKNGWGFVTTDDADVIWSPGKLTQVVTKKDYTYTSWTGKIYKDVAVEVEAQPSSDSRIVWAGYGITFGIGERGVQDSYNFVTTTTGQYFLRKWVDGKVVKPYLVETTSSAYVQPRPSKNRLGVLIEGSKISLYINGYLVQTVTDDSYRGGKVGVFTSTSSDLAQADFSRVRVLSVERARLEWGTRLAGEPPPPNGVWFDDDFSSEMASRDKGWTWGKDDSNKAELLWSPQKMSIVVSSRDYAQVSSPGGRVLTDFAAEIEAEPSSDSRTQAANYGIVFRISGEQNRDFYRFGVDTSGQYHLVKVLGGRNIEPPLIDFTSSSYIKPRPSKNRLGVLVEGAKISLYINGYLVKTLTDDSIKRGHVGVFAGSAWGEWAQVDFTRLTVYTVEKAKAQWSAQLAGETAPPSGILFQDDFGSQQASTDKGWSFSTSANVDTLWLPNKYTLVLKEKNLIHSSLLLGDYEDFAVEIEALAESADPRTEYGIVFRSNAEEGSAARNYSFGIASFDKGETYSYFLSKEIDGKTPEPWPVEVRPSPQIKPGPAKNRLAVLAEGSTISLYINGQRVRTIADDSLSSGKVGVFVHNVDTDRAQVAFNRVTIYTVEKAKAEWGAPVVTPGILYEGDFSSKQKTEDDGWDFTPSEGTDLVWSPNKLTIITRTGGQFNGPYYTRYKDFGIEIEAQPEDKPQLVYGLYFRQIRKAGKDSDYAFCVTPSGKYFLYKRIDGKVVEPYLVDITPSPYLKTGSSKNRLGVLAEGSKISLFINGNLVKTISDDSMPYGYVGVIALPSGYDRAQVDFNRLIVYTVDKAKQEWGVPATVVPEPTSVPGILFHDDFSSNQRSQDLGWNFGVFGANQRTWTLSPNRLTVTLQKKGAWDIALPDPRFNDFGVELEAQSEDKPGIQYGVVFRNRFTQDLTKEYLLSFYLFAVTGQGEYSVLKMIDGNWTEKDPVPSTPSPFINKGSSKNRLGVMAEGSRISLYINGNLVKTITDDSLSSGGLGAFAFSGPNDNAQVSFSRMTIYTVEKAKSELGASPATPAPQLTNAAPSAPRPTTAATSMPPPTTASSGILFQEDFGSEQACKDRGWNFETTQNVDEVWSPNKLSVTLKKANTISFSRPAMSPSKDYGVEMEAQPENRPGTEYGLVLRYGGATDARTYYLYAITLDGKYYLKKRVSGVWADVDPVAATSSPFIKPGATTNRLGALVEGTKISLYINGNLVKTVTDDSIAGGVPALVVVTGDNPLARVVFTRMTVYTVEKARTELSKR